MKLKLLGAFSGFLLVLSMFFVPSVSASEINVDVDDILASKGVPSDIISIMPDSQKNELISYDDFWYSGSTTSIVDMEVPNTNDDSRATISSSQLKLTGYGFTYQNGNLKLAELTTSYEWLDEPVFYFTDQIGMSWDASLFESIGDTAWMYCTYTDQYGNETHWYSFDKREITSSDVIMDVNMVANKRSYGTATIKLLLKSNVTPPAYTTFYFKYGHAKLVPSVTMSINKGGVGIGFSTGINVDTLANNKLFMCNW